MKALVKKAVIKYIYKIKGYIPVWKQSKLTDHDWKNSSGDMWSTFGKDHSSAAMSSVLEVL